MPQAEDVRDPSVRRGEFAGGGRSCPRCGAVFVSTRWEWAERLPEHAQMQLCPACRRIRDHLPAGSLGLRGRFLIDHRADVLALLHRAVAAQAAEFPLRRLVDIRELDGEFEVSFTDGHLPQIVGEQLQRAFGGELRIEASEHSELVRASWRR